MNALTARIFATFPPELQSQVRSHRFDDIDEVVQAVALALFEARGKTTMYQIFKRARSNVRRFSQDLARHSAGLDAVAEIAVADQQDPTPLRRRDITRELAQTHGVTPRRARQIVAEQIERAKVNRDLFADDKSEVTA